MMNTAGMSLSEQIKQYAFSVGFDAVGICRMEEVDSLTGSHLRGWLKKGYQADMDYLSRNVDKRLNPGLLVEGAKSVICIALNYYPAEKQPETVPQFAYYAYGKDYHEVVKNKLYRLYDFIQSICPQAGGRVFVDTAPVLERYWAAKAGIGFIGKNTMLIMPGKGSFYFLGEIIVNIELEYDKPLSVSCGKCERCQTACPTGAFDTAYCLNSHKCISYQTIENKGDIDKNIIPYMGSNLYGCDICQKVCPFNRFAAPNKVEEFSSSDEFLSLDQNALGNMTEEDYRRIFKGSAVKRAKFSGLMRNLKALNSKRID